MNHKNLPHDDLLLNVRKDLVSDLPEFKKISEDHFRLSTENSKSLETLLKESEGSKDPSLGIRLTNANESFNRKQQDLDKQIQSAIRNAHNPLLVKDNFIGQNSESELARKKKGKTEVIRFKNNTVEYERPSEKSKKVLDILNPPSHYEQSAIDDLEEESSKPSDKKAVKDNNSQQQQPKKVKFDSCPADEERPDEIHRNNYLKKYRGYGRQNNPKCFYKKYNYYNLSNVEYDQNLSVSSAFDFLRELKQREKKNKTLGIEDEMEDLNLAKPVFNKKVIKKKMINEEDGPVKVLKHKLAVLSFQDEL